MHLYTKYLLRPSCLSLAQAVDGVKAAVMRSPAVSVIPAIIHLHSKYGLYQCPEFSIISIRASYMKPL